MNKFEFFKTGAIQSSYGGQFSYKVIGPCCRLYDREELPGLVQGWPGAVKNLAGEGLVQGL